MGVGRENRSVHLIYLLFIISIKIIESVCDQE